MEAVYTALLHLTAEHVAYAVLWHTLFYSSGLDLHRTLGNFLAISTLKGETIAFPQNSGANYPVTRRHIP